MCGCILKFALNESIIKQFISYIFCCYFALNQNVLPNKFWNHKIVLYFEYWTVNQRLKDYLKFCTTTELSL